MSTREATETARIRTGIEQTRSEMSATIDAIQEKLNPQHIADQVRHSVHEQIEQAKSSVRDATIGKAEALMRDAGDTFNDARYTTTETIRHNPIPAAMIAIGLGWLFMNRSSPRRERYDEYTRRRSSQNLYRGDQYEYRGDPYRGDMYYNANHPAYRGEAMAMYGTTQRQDEGTFAQGQRRVGEAVGEGQRRVGEAVSEGQRRVGETVGNAQQAVGDAAYRAQRTVGDAAQTAASAVGDAANQIQETAGAIAGRTVYAAGRVEDRFERLLWENPLAVGAMALAMGAAAGFALPPTERENELMGEARENLFHQAQEVAQETVSKVQKVATEVVKEAEHTASDESRKVGLTK